MSKKNWKRVTPISMRHAIELCVLYGKEKKNLSVQRIADGMGIESYWTLYKWMENGRIPAILIRPFENVTGAKFVTQYIALSAHQVVFDIPRGLPLSEDKLLDMNNEFNTALQLLKQFYAGEVEANETLAALTATLTTIASHRENVTKSATPELALFED